MLEEEIMMLRENLNNSIKYDEKYEIIYEISIKLDKLILEYYKENIKTIKT